METKNYDVRVYCHYADLRRIISLLYDHSNGFVEYDFSVNRLPESPIEYLNEEINTFTTTPGQISEKYQVISFPSFGIRGTLDFVSSLSNLTVEDPLYAYVFVFSESKVIYVRPL